MHITCNFGSLYMKRMKKWLHNASLVNKFVILAILSVIFLGVLSAAAQPAINTSVINEVKSSPKIETKPLSITEAIPYTSSTVNNSSLDQGVTRIVTKGVDGVLTHTYQVVYADGVETSRSKSIDTITTPVVNEVVEIGTKIPTPICSNGTYINSSGNTVCRPETSTNIPSGATARCSDGTYSFSQSRSGTCSHHNGVAEWL